MAKSSIALHAPRLCSCKLYPFKSVPSVFSPTLPTSATSPRSRPLPPSSAGDDPPPRACHPAASPTPHHTFLARPTAAVCVSVFLSLAQTLEHHLAPLIVPQHPPRHLHQQLPQPPATLLADPPAPVAQSRLIPPRLKPAYEPPDIHLLNRCGSSIHPPPSPPAAGQHPECSATTPPAALWLFSPAATPTPAKHQLFGFLDQSPL